MQNTVSNWIHNIICVACVDHNITNKQIKSKQTLVGFCSHYSMDYMYFVIFNPFFPKFPWCFRCEKIPKKCQNFKLASFGPSLPRYLPEWCFYDALAPCNNRESAGRGGMHPEILEKISWKICRKIWMKFRKRSFLIFLGTQISFRSSFRWWFSFLKVTPTRERQNWKGDSWPAHLTGKWLVGWAPKNPGPMCSWDSLMSSSFIAFEALRYFGYPTWTTSIYRHVFPSNNYPDSTVRRSHSTYCVDAHRRGHN